ncbi:hypothetical protein K443DRAFT_85163, partial [Laccaria amethystina LaAM-08-1]
TSQSQLPLYCLFSTAEADYLVNPFATFLDYVDHWEGLSDAAFAWHSKSDGAGILDKTRLSSCSMSTSGYRGQGSDKSFSMGRKEGGC